MSQNSCLLIPVNLFISFLSVPTVALLLPPFPKRRALLLSASDKQPFIPLFSLSLYYPNRAHWHNKDRHKCYQTVQKHSHRTQNDPLLQSYVISHTLLLTHTRGLPIFYLQAMESRGNNYHSPVIWSSRHCCIVLLPGAARNIGVIAYVSVGLTSTLCCLLLCYKLAILWVNTLALAFWLIAAISQTLCDKICILFCCYR